MEEEREHDLGCGSATGGWSELYGKLQVSKWVRSGMVFNIRTYYSDKLL